MNCLICNKEIIGRTDKKYCSRKCKNKSTNDKAVKLSLTLLPYQIENILKLQEKYLIENKGK